MRYWKTKTALVAAAIAAAAWAGAVTPASAATPSCGASCISIFNHKFSHRFTVDSIGQGTRTGTPLILFQASNTDPAEDFTVASQGPVSDFYTAGLVSSSLKLHYGCVSTVKKPCSGVDDSAYELEYSPYGAPTGECAGTAVTAAAGTQVSLQPCGVTAKTVWVVDTWDAAITAGKVPLINGSDTNFSQPFVLTYPGSSYPTDKPRPVLYTANLTGSAAGPGGPELGTVSDNQLWSAVYGPLP